MKTINRLFLFIAILLSTTAFAQNPSMVYGILLDENSEAVEGVTVYYELNGQKVEVISDYTGFYKIEIPVLTKVTIWFSHISFDGLFAEVTLLPGQSRNLNFSLRSVPKELQQVTVGNNSKALRDRVQAAIPISIDIIKHIPTASGGIESMLKAVGANSNDELSSQYSVRGGSYDENLVYVEDFEIYRPFLIRSGQQEGLSFTNTAMVSNVDFYAGGFQAKYGDKLSSVLDIKYRRPLRYGAQAEASFLGGSVTVEGISKNGKLSAIAGARYRDNSLLVNSKETESNFRPSFLDFQTMINYKVTTNWELTFLGNIAQNKYNYEPLTRQTNFGTIDDPRALQIFYQGEENDKYGTYFGAVKSTYKVSENFLFKIIGSLYHTQEQEYFDILAEYALGEVDTNINSETFGGVQFARAAGSQLTHARNNLDALIANAEIKGEHNIKRHKVEWGFKYTREDIRDRVVEWEVIDSAGFSIRPPLPDDLPVNDQPYNPYTGPLVPFQNVRALNFTQINRLSGFIQWTHRAKLGEADLWINAGARAHQWQVIGDNIADGDSQMTISPRAQLSLKPKWEKDIMFRLSGGFYHQPPFYRELRDQQGMVRPNVKAQQSIHAVAGSDYSFEMWGDRKFKLVTEAYYKKLDNVNTYTLENVRLRYRANNDAVAYAYGVDVRMNGEFVKGTESWVTFGYMKTEENISSRGYIARPTDQRLKFGMLFQDYVPNMENVKMYLNLVYNTGLPGGSPSYADSYAYQARLNDYRRADAGFAYVFTDGTKEYPKGHWLAMFRELTVGLEIFNLFNNQNAITNTWVRDVDTKSQYGIPNYLTSRVFSLKLNVSI